VLRLLYLIDMPPAEAGILLGITRQGIAKLETNAIKRIAQHIEI